MANGPAHTRLPSWRDTRFCAPCWSVPPPSFRRKRPWCTTPSTWWPPPLNAPPRSPSAPCSATDTNPGASDHASWTCSKTWVRFSGPYPQSSIHPIHPYHSSPPRRFPRAAGAETEELVDQIRRVFATVALRLVSGDKGGDGTCRFARRAGFAREDRRALVWQFIRDSEAVSYGLDKYSAVQLQGKGTVNMGPV